eukprot:TRINITY_DN43845_c0_g1_i1.p1 TRINITY_DN43845_c0_g1~~TRINITY_DN43845_c0_g1_i1.p1  ORF type:complete len:285 (-),score=51.47 TRINITY_DN43845_c0_g1_i1:76-882(-)
MESSSARLARGQAHRISRLSRRLSTSGTALLGLLFWRLCLPSCGFAQPPRSQANSADDDVVTTEDVQRAARRLNVELRENVAGPWYQIELYSGDRQLGKTSGWAQPWGSLHLETIEVRKFTGYWVTNKKKSDGAGSDEAESQSEADKAEEKKRYADVAKVARWFGLLLSVAIACWNRERSPFYCKDAYLLAIKDEDMQHKKLVRYYKGLGFTEVKSNEELNFQDQIVWGGEGMLMRTDADTFMKRWTPVVRELAGPSRMRSSENTSEE